MNTRLRPRILVDIHKETGPFSNTQTLVNLRPRRLFVVPITAMTKIVVIAGALLMFLFGTVSAPILAVTQEQLEERQRLEEQLAEYEQMIVEYEKTLSTYRQEGQTLSSEINRLEANISKINLQIQAITVSLRKLDQEIRDTESTISQTETQITESKTALVDLLRNIYEQDAETMMEILIKNPRLSDFFGSVNNLIALQDSIRVSLNQIVSLREQLVEQKDQLAEERLDVIAMQHYQATQRQKIQEIQTEKAQLLKATKGKESEYKELIEETRKTAAEIRTQIFKLLGGGELAFGDAYQIARFAEQATGIRAAFILAVLSQESAINGIIGRNLGQCYYNDSWNNASGSVMKDSWKPTFLAIIRELNLDPDTTPVSCPIPRDGAYGGAMGPAQFIPTTWELFKNKISAATGNVPPSPFNNGDAFMGTALYLKDAYDSSACRTYASDYAHISPQQLLRERCAAARYYAGGNWWNYRWIYGDPVAERANRFQEDIDILLAG